MAYEFAVCDRLGRNPTPLLQAADTRLRVALRQPTSLSFTVSHKHVLAGALKTGDAVLVKVYDTTLHDANPATAKTLRLVAPPWNYSKHRDENGGSLSVQCSVGPRISRREIGQDPAGAVIGDPINTVDRGEIMARILDALNQGDATNIFTRAGDTGIRRGAIGASSQSYYGPQRYYKADKAWAELSGTLDGPDWEIAATEPTVDALGVQIGVLNTYAAQGTLQPNAIFEFGMGKRNVASWDDVGDFSAAANAMTAIPGNWPTDITVPPAVAQDLAAIAANGLSEDSLTTAISDTTMLGVLAQEHVDVRKAGKRVIQFTPIPEDPSLSIDQRRVPRPLVDYGIGDVVEFRAMEEVEVVDLTTGAVTAVQERLEVDGLFRVYSIEIQVDQNGVPLATTSTVVQE